MSEVVSILTRVGLRTSSSFSLAGTAQWREIITIHTYINLVYTKAGT